MCDANLNGLKLTQFWPDDPALWFAQTEAQFWYHNITDDFTKYNYIIAHLDKHCLTVVKDIVLAPPATKKYETLKSELFKRLKETKMKNIKDVLSSEDIGNKKPSEYLKHLKELAGPDIDEDYLKSVWSSRLPDKVQWVASFLTSSSLDKIAQLADLAINSPSMTVPKQTNKDVTTRELTQRLEELTKRVDVLTLKSEHEANTRPMSANSSHKELESSAKMASKLNQLYKTPTDNKKKWYMQTPLIVCWYHEMFGGNALKCEQPCNFKTLF